MGLAGHRWKFKSAGYHPAAILETPAVGPERFDAAFGRRSRLTEFSLAALGAVLRRASAALGKVPVRTTMLF